MTNNFFLPKYSDSEKPCRDLYFSYSLAFLLSKLPTLDCGPNQEDYTYQLARSLNNRIEGGKYIKMTLNLEPCTSKHIALEMLDFRLVLAIYVRVECGLASISLDNDQSYYPVTTFLMDLGYLTCGNQEQVITEENKSLRDLYFKSSTKEEETQITLIVLGI